jgi:FtsZ-binding cell division protein ZapB
MTEQEFDSQVWRRFDVVTTDTGIETTVMNVCFTTRSVRIYVKNAPPEWMPCKRIEKHTTRKGDEADDASIIEELHIKVISQQDTIDRLKKEIDELKEKQSRNHVSTLLSQVNIVGNLLQEKKKRMENIDAALMLINETVQKVYVDNV